MGSFERRPDHLGPLIERWDGTAWHLVRGPNLRFTGASLSAVTAIASHDVWAVGYHYNITGVSRPLAIHWNGAAWQIARVSSPAPGETVLADVTARTANDVWAVGHWSDPFGTSQTLIEHWDGSTWSITASPNVGTDSNELVGIASLAADDAWAVGYEGDLLGNNLEALYEHWDGSRWSVVGSESLNPDYLTAVDALSSDDVWAAGDLGNFDPTFPNTPNSEHWDGGGWTRVKPVTPGLGDSGFSDVAALGASDVWAVGRYTPSAPLSNQTLAEHWDGSAWTQCATPNASDTENLLLGVDSVAGSVWAVGIYESQDGVSRTLIEQLPGS